MKSIPAELEAKLDEIKSWMFNGDQDEVAKRAGVKKQNVSAQLNKKQVPSKKVLDAAIEVMNENKARFEIRETMKIAS
jgi:transcriptional regulator with XRE-family HTH domain